MSARRFRKKPVEIEAVRWTGENPDDVSRFCNAGWFGDDDGRSFVIFTLEGEMRADVGDWIICGVKGEFYPCKPDIFEASYDEVSGD